MQIATKAAKHIIPIASFINNSELISYFVVTLMPMLALALGISLETLKGVIFIATIKF